MTTIAAGLPVRADMGITADKSDDPVGEEFVGNGNGFARFVGGATGAGIGIGALVGITALAGKSNVMPVRIAGLVTGLGAVGGGAYFGHKLLGHATRQTAPEHARELTAMREDLAIKYRIDVAEASGADRKQVSEARELQRERTHLAKAGPDQSVAAAWGLPIALGIGVAAGAAMLAFKHTPDDGKGINAMFNAMGGMIGGGAAGLGIGAVAADALFPGTRLAEIPAADAARISEIDAKLVDLVGPAK